MKVIYKNNFMDGIRYIFYTMPRSRTQKFFTLLFALYVLFLFRKSVFSTERPVWIASIALVIIVLLFTLGFVLLSLLLNIIAVLLNRRFFTEKSLEISESGIVSSSQGARVELDWNMIQKIRRTKKQVLFYVNDRCAYIVPTKYFENNEKLREFYDYASKRIKE